MDDQTSSKGLRALPLAIGPAGACEARMAEMTNAEMRNDPGVGAFAALLGIRRTAMADGRSRFELDVSPSHLNPHGIVHGGVVYSLADYAMGGALTSRLHPGERCATLEIKINYLAAVSQGTLAAEAQVVERTRRVGVLEARVLVGDRLVALATGTFYIQASA